MCSRGRMRISLLAAASIALWSAADCARSPITQSSPLQLAAERAVGTRRACVVALDVRNGRVLALVNADMACRRSYPPGSILKLLTAFAGLESGLIKAEESTECRGVRVYGRQRLVCSAVGGHGKMDLRSAIAQSCNMYFYGLGRKLGPAGLIGCWREFGLGGLTGTSGTSESRGCIPHVLRGDAEIARAAVGQAPGLKITPLQMAIVCSAIANGGIEYSPITSPKAKPKVLRRIPSHPGTLQLIRNAMRMAVVEGTARRAYLSAVQVCGKTGSPEVDGHPQFRHAWFAGFAPYRHPQIAVVVLSEWGHGGHDAAPIAREVFRAYAASHHTN